MPERAEPEIQKLVHELRDQAAGLDRAGEEGRQVLRALEPGLRGVYQELGVGEDGRLRSGAWDGLADSAKQGLEKRILGALSAIKEAAAKPEEPTERGSVMFRAHASNLWVFALVSLSVVVTVVLLYLVYKFWGTATLGTDPKAAAPAEKDVLRMVIFMGALGGTIHWMSSLVTFIGNGSLLRRWIPYYLLAPLQGAALALIVYLLLRVGVLSPTTNANATQHLNLLGMYAVAGLTGLFAKQAIEMLREVFNVVFKKVEAKDPSGGATKPQQAGGTAATESQQASA